MFYIETKTKEKTEKRNRQLKSMETPFNLV